MLRRNSAGRASGHANRSKSRSRRTTYRTVGGLMEFANHGLWPVPPAPSTWLTIEESSALAAVHADVISCLNRFQEWRKSGRRIGDVLEDTIKYALPSPKDEPGDCL